MKLALFIIMLTTAGLSLMLAIGGLFSGESGPGNGARRALFVCLAVFQVQGALVLRNFLFEYPAVFFLHLTALYLVGALLYLWLRPAVAPRKTRSNADVLFFIPSLVALGFDIFYLVQPETNKFLLLGNFFLGGYLRFGLVITALIAGVGVQAAILMGALLVMRAGCAKDAEQASRPRVGAARIILPLVLVDLAAAGYIVKFPATPVVISLVLVFVIIGAGIGFIRKGKRQRETAAGPPQL